MASDPEDPAFSPEAFTPFKLRDMVVENRVDHVRSWEQVRFLPGVFEALRALAAAGVPAVLVTNQAAVAQPAPGTVMLLPPVLG